MAMLCGSSTSAIRAGLYAACLALKNNQTEGKINMQFAELYMGTGGGSQHRSKTPIGGDGGAFVFGSRPAYASWKTW